MACIFLILTKRDVFMQNKQTAFFDQIKKRGNQVKKKNQLGEL